MPICRAIIPSGPDLAACDVILDRCIFVKHIAADAPPSHINISSRVDIKRIGPIVTILRTIVCCGPLFHSVVVVHHSSIVIKRTSYTAITCYAHISRRIQRNGVSIFRTRVIIIPGNPDLGSICVILYCREIIRCAAPITLTCNIHIPRSIHSHCICSVRIAAVVNRHPILTSCTAVIFYRGIVITSAVSVDPTSYIDIPC